MMLGTFCERLGITSGLINSELIGMMDELFESLRSHMSGGTNRTPLVRLKGMTHEQLESFFEGVKLFYVQAPWQFTATDSAWKIEFADKPDQPWWAVVMGQNGETYGLAFYEDWHSLHGMLTGEIDGLTADFTTKVSCICLSFDEASVLAGADLDAIEQFEWPIAAPEAYPLLYRIKPNVGIHTPSTGDLKLLESVLRTLPDFIRSGKPDGSVLAKLHDGELQFKITKVNLNDREATPSSRGRNRRR
ncbi:MAG: hypothetical protein FJ267_18510 [Planctomycetes bacterium]|nr:hypothetical protein [Planctomycetota bacterium]